MVDAVEVKASDIVLLFTQIKILETKIKELTKQQQQMATTIEELTQPRKPLWKSIMNYFQWG